MEFFNDSRRRKFLFESLEMRDGIDKENESIIRMYRAFLDECFASALNTSKTAPKTRLREEYQHFIEGKDWAPDLIQGPMVWDEDQEKLVRGPPATPGEADKHFRLSCLLADVDVDVVRDIYEELKKQAFGGNR